jgi:Gpi18-like mannosyltransferase
MMMMMMMTMMMTMVMTLIARYIALRQARLMAESVQLFQRNNDVVNSLKNGINWGTFCSALHSPPVQMLIAFSVALISAVCYAFART